MKKNNILSQFISSSDKYKKTRVSNFLRDLRVAFVPLCQKFTHSNQSTQINTSSQAYVFYVSMWSKTYTARQTKSKYSSFFSVSPWLKTFSAPQKHISLILLTTASLLFSCSPKTIGETPKKIERKKTSELVSVLDSLSLQKPDTFYSKISTKYRDTTQNISFKTSVRMVKDSAFSALITYASIPIYNSILTPDSLTILNKRSKCFTKTKLNYIKDNFGIAFDYKNVEELLLGMPLAYDVDQKYFQIHDQNNYIVSSHRKREIKRSDKKDKLQDDIIIKYYLSNDLKSLNKLEIESKSDTARIEVNFISRQAIDNYNVPNEVFIKVFTPRNEIQVEMNYDKVEINVTQQLYLVIPEGYEACE